MHGALYHTGLHFGKSGKKRHSVSGNNYLIRRNLFCMVRAMFKLVVIFISILWASLVLISWGSVAESELIKSDSVSIERGDS
jgi:hypothetical protein